MNYGCLLFDLQTTLKQGCLFFDLQTTMVVYYLIYRQPWLSFFILTEKLIKGLTYTKKIFNQQTPFTKLICRWNRKSHPARLCPGYSFSAQNIINILYPDFITPCSHTLSLSPLPTANYITSPSHPMCSCTLSPSAPPTVSFSTSPLRRSENDFFDLFNLPHLGKYVVRFG